MSVTYLGYLHPETEDEVRLEIVGIEIAISTMQRRKAELEAGLLWANTVIQDEEQEKPTVTPKEEQVQTEREIYEARKAARKGAKVEDEVEAPSNPQSTKTGLKKIIKEAIAESNAGN